MRVRESYWRSCFSIGHAGFLAGRGIFCSLRRQPYPEKVMYLIKDFTCSEALSIRSSRQGKQLILRCSKLASSASDRNRLHVFWRFLESERLPMDQVSTSLAIFMRTSTGSSSKVWPGCNISTVGKNPIMSTSVATLLNYKSEKLQGCVVLIKKLRLLEQETRAMRVTLTY